MQCNELTINLSTYKHYLRTVSTVLAFRVTYFWDAGPQI
jgi:hypothetical protein